MSKDHKRRLPERLREQKAFSSSWAGNGKEDVSEAAPLMYPFCTLEVGETVRLSSCASHHFVVWPVPLWRFWKRSSEHLSLLGHPFGSSLPFKPSTFQFPSSLRSAEGKKFYWRAADVPGMRRWKSDLPNVGHLPGEKMHAFPPVPLRASFCGCCPAEDQGKAVRAQAKKNRWSWETVPAGVPVTWVWPWATDQCFGNLTGATCLSLNLCICPVGTLFHLVGFVCLLKRNGIKYYHGITAFCYSA